MAPVPVIGEPVQREQEIQSLMDYLERLESGGFISQLTSLNAKEVWNDLARVTNDRLMVPNASAGPDGMLLLTWDRGRYHLELEFLPEQVPTFFYFDRDASTGWEVVYDASRELRDRLLRDRLLPVFGLFY